MLSDQLGIGSMIRTLDPDQQEGVTLVSREGPSRILGIDDVDTGDDAGPETDGEQAADGAAVKTGDAVCVVEAMKLFNPIKAPAAGKITFLVEHGKPVTKGQPVASIHGDSV